MPPALGDAMFTMLARQVRVHVQSGFQAVERLWLQDRVGHVGQVVDVVGQHRAVLVEELRVVVSSWLRSCSALATSRSVLVNALVNFARSVVEGDELLIALVSALTNSARLLTTPKKSPRPSFRVVSASDRLFSVLLICSPLPRRPSENGFDDVAERALGLFLGRAEVGQDPVERVAQFVVLDRHLGAVHRDDRAVLHDRSAGVGRRQLDGARRDQAGVQDRGGGVGRHLVLVVVVERHLHLVAGGFDRVDLCRPGRP